MNISTTENGDLVLEGVVDEDFEKIKKFFGKAEIFQVEKIFPLPCIRDENGRKLKKYSLEEWTLDLQRKLCRAISPYHVQEEKLVELIGACVSRLETLGFDEDARAKLYKNYNAEKFRRGLLEVRK